MGNFIESKPGAKLALNGLDCMAGPLMFTVKQVPVVEKMIDKAIGEVTSLLAGGFIGVDGTDVLGLAKAMQNNGVSAARWRNALSIEELAIATSKGNSAIVQMDLANSSHFFVVDGVTTRAAMSSEKLLAVRDPWQGTQYFLPEIEFKKKFTGWGVVTNPNKR